MTNFVQIAEFNRILEDKVDLDMLQDLNAQKASCVEVDSLKKLIDRVAYEMEHKPGFKDLEKQSISTNDLIEELQRELLLKASIKDLTQLLDQKVNVGDMN